MADSFIRILSDVHYGERSSRVRSLAQLRPLADGVDLLVSNGDMLDTRPGPRPEHTRECRAEVAAFAAEHTAAMTLLTGNHDPDLSPDHFLALAGGQVVATHGDIVFDDIVPWGRDGPLMRTKIAAALHALPAHERPLLARRFAIWRAVAGSLPQRHQSEPSALKHAWRLLNDIASPQRIARIFKAWRTHAPGMGEFARLHWPAARFLVIGHTHRPRITRLADGRIVINTGSYCPPLGGFVVDVAGGTLQVRQVERRGNEFRPGTTVAAFPLAAG